MKRLWKILALILAPVFILSCQTVPEKLIPEAMLYSGKAEDKVQK